MAPNVDAVDRAGQRHGLRRIHPFIAGANQDIAAFLRLLQDAGIDIAAGRGHVSHGLAERIFEPLLASLQFLPAFVFGNERQLAMSGAVSAEREAEAAKFANFRFANIAWFFLRAIAREKKCGGAIVRGDYFRRAHGAGVAIVERQDCVGSGSGCFNRRRASNCSKLSTTNPCAQEERDDCRVPVR